MEDSTNITETFGQNHFYKVLVRCDTGLLDLLELLLWWIKILVLRSSRAVDDYEIIEIYIDCLKDDDVFLPN